MDAARVYPPSLQQFGQFLQQEGLSSDEIQQMKEENYEEHGGKTIYRLYGRGINGSVTTSYVLISSTGCMSFSRQVQIEALST